MCEGFCADDVPPSPNSHAYVSGSPSGSVPVAVKAIAVPVVTSPLGVRAASTVGCWLACGVLPHAADGTVPAVISMPACRCPSIAASENEASVCASPLYQARPPSKRWHQAIGWSSSTPSEPSASA